MIAILKSIHSPDVPDLKSYRPKEKDSFGVFLEVRVGAKGEDVAESFGVTVCTPSWLEQRMDRDAILLGRHHLFVREWSYERVHAFIERFCSDASDASWDRIAQNMSRLGKWEFEDYRG